MNPQLTARTSKTDRSLWIQFLALIAIPAIGVIHYYVGKKISFFVFYLPPIALAGWFGSRLLGFVAAIAATLVWLFAERHFGNAGSDASIVYLNAALRFVVFGAFGLLFAGLRRTQDYLEATVSQKASELQKEITERTRIQREVAQTFSNQQRQIAYDLHDGVGQHLSGIAFKSKLLEQKLRAEGSKQADEAAAITTLINEALRQTRTVARGMESTYGEAHGLKDALHKLAEELRLSSQVSAVVNVDESSEMVGAPVDMQLFRITQEAVHNAISHGHAKNIEIALQASSDAIVLTVDDDGEGFEEGPPGNGMGMRTMQYRAQTIGGMLTVNSRRGGGTTISCSVPKAQHHREVSARLSL